MKLSTRTRYGTRALIELGAAYPEICVSAREIADRQGLSVKYLEHLMMLLKVSGLIVPVRGSHGGYTLSRPPNAIKLSEIFGVLEGSTALVECVDHPGLCDRAGDCPSRDTWVDLSTALGSLLEGRTLADLVENHSHRSSRTRADGQSFRAGAS